jgi:hypothetical protein
MGNDFLLGTKLAGIFLLSFCQMRQGVAHNTQDKDLACPLRALDVLLVLCGVSDIQTFELRAFYIFENETFGSHVQVMMHVWPKGV